jgi:hypothetical protein
MRCRKMDAIDRGKLSKPALELVSHLIPRLVVKASSCDSGFL